MGLTDSLVAADAATRIAARSGILFREQQHAVYRRTDRLFAGLMIFQWFAGVLVALWVSPRAWAGASSSIHPHLWSALLLGGAIISLPVFLAFARPGWVLTRHVI